MQYSPPPSPLRRIIAIPASRSPSQTKMAVNRKGPGAQLELLLSFKFVQARLLNKHESQNSKRKNSSNSFVQILKRHGIKEFCVHTALFASELE